MRRIRSRKLIAFATGSLLTAPLALAAPSSARAGEPAYTVTPLTFTVTVGADNATRCLVDADLYRPVGVDAAHRAPAVLTTNGFGGSKADGSTDAIAKAFASRGYVVLAYSGLGFGKSGCRISLDDPAIDGKAASRLVSYLGTRDFVTKDGSGDPRVGMIGGSYGGAVQLATASIDRRVDALVPLITWNDLGYSLATNSTDTTRGVSSGTPGVYKWQWTNLFFQIGQAQGLLNIAVDPSRASAGCVNFVPRACDTKYLLDSGRFPAEPTRRAFAFARSVSPVSYLSRVKAPTLLIQGENDTLFHLNEAAATYATLRAQGTTAKMIWQSWGHSGGMTDPAPGELNIGTGNLDSSYVGRRILAWFDRYLHRRTATSTGPAFAYYRDWAPGYGTSSAFPVGTAQRLHLSGDGTLVDSASQVRRGSLSYHNGPTATSHSESPLAGRLGPLDPEPYDTPGTFVAYSSAPLSGAVDVVGAPKVTLKVDSPAAEQTQGETDVSHRLVLFAKIYDVAPDGTQTLVNRLVAPARVKDVTRRFTVTLPAVVHRYEPGHRLRLVIAASDDAFYGNRGIKTVTVTSAPGDSGFLDLPVVGGR
ncbi:CocE/NonD family hydrolase [Streptomyces sp. KR80]|uniref:CocE/NonD family hydrolase n=1 Tax=Streptomyces sp. KR80 TaxID=3457426 RepID=UPI003FD5D293